MKDLPGEWMDHQLTVALRIRPLNEAEIEEGATIVAHKIDNQMVVLMDPCEDSDNVLRAHRSREKTYMFDLAFDYTATQEDVYVATTKNLIDGVIAGYNATVFAYGPTGAGKTHTMLGLDSEPGIYIRTLNDLFRAIEDSTEDLDCSVYMSYIEIYNEMIRDLLNPSSGYLELREDGKGEIRIAGITEFSTCNAKEIMALLTKGNKQRTQESTAANKTSSRSHAILQVTVKQKSRVKDINEEVRVGKLFMVDLAGTERASQTQNRGKRMKEGAHINRSLLALANCINALSEKGGKGAQFVNYRDSKLTRLLKDALGGNSRTVMITHISPASSNFEESRNTLVYADKAKNIRTKVKRNLMNVSYHLAQYTRIIADLRSEIERLRAKIDQQSQDQLKGEKADIRNIQAEVQQYSHGEMALLQEQLLSAFREQMEIRRSLMELENCNMELHIDTSRHLLTISDWERDRARARREKDELSGQKKHTDKEEEQESMPEEPQYVTAAREEIGPLLAEQRKTMELKRELEEKLLNMKLKSSKIEELLPKRISNTEQRDILMLLCKVHELELEKTEIQSAVLCKENVLRTKDFIIQRHEQQRTLCDDIIHQQKMLIEDQGLCVPEGLQELYSLYFGELSDGIIDQILNLHTFTTNNLNARQLRLDVISNLEEADKAEQSNVKFSPLDKHPRDSSSSGLDYDSDTNRVFKSLSKIKPRRQHHSSSSQTLMRKVCAVKDSTPICPTESVSPDTLREIVSDTKSISVIAAKRRSRLQAKSNSRMAGMGLAAGLKSSVSMDSLVSTLPDESAEVRRSHQRHGGSSQSKQDPKRTEGRTELPEKQQHKKRSRSFEASKRQVQKPRQNASRYPALESISDNHLVRPALNIIQPLNGGPANPATPPVAKVKIPVSHFTGEVQFQKLEIRGTPPSTIHQKHSDTKRAQAVYKRQRGQGDVCYPSSLLQQAGNYKKSTNENPKQKAMADVNRKNETRQRNKHAVKKSYV
ncbi:kinesin-like protein KIF19 [Danio rerio]|uniref:Kinesin-like protein KIF19 n=4 Tax=Danio rerio TaxID=7955 RepID=A0A8M1Q799_DANRE|nr:kinesin-like protein KIF19 isoform X1 [Danio rerio]XP_009304780.1 kinesin-like protein KIF19 isoform X1 [Danio rerio]|eukprot:XP_001337836.4 kinesin-like protein KIF19 isoform X1 [Danio rerio]